MRRSTFLGALFLLAGCGANTPAEAPPVEAGKPEPAPQAAAAPLLLASGVWAPFTDKENKPRFAVELVHEALKRSDVSFETTITSPQELMPGLESGAFEGSEALWLTEKRKEYLLYSEPYLENRLVLLGRKGSVVTAKSVAELSGKKLGVVKDYAYGPEILKTQGPELVFGASDEDNLRSLLKEEVDYIIVDSLLVYFLFEYSREKANDKLAVGSSPLATRSLHFAVRKDREGAAAIIEKFNAQLPQMSRDGTYHRLLHVTWIVADVDGDGTKEHVARGDQVGKISPQSEYKLTSGDLPTGTRFVIEGETYVDWEHVPPEYKVPGIDPIDTFRPAVNAVLFEF